MTDADRRAPHSAALTMLGNMLFNLRQPQRSCDRDEVVRCLAEVEETLRWEVAALRAPAPVPGGGASEAPIVEFYQQDWIPGFAAFLPGATTPHPDSRAFCVLNLGALLATVAHGDVARSDLPGFVVESMIHEVGHVLEQWAGVEFSEERQESLTEKYRASAVIDPPRPSDPAAREEVGS